MTIALIAVLLLGGALGGFAAFGGRGLLGWYVREARQAEIPQDPEDAIVTYPLA